MSIILDIVNLAMLAGVQPGDLRPFRTQLLFTDVSIGATADSFYGVLKVPPGYVFAATFGDLSSYAVDETAGNPYPSDQYNRRPYAPDRVVISFTEYGVLQTPGTGSGGFNINLFAGEIFKLFRGTVLPVVGMMQRTDDVQVSLDAVWYVELQLSGFLVPEEAADRLVNFDMVIR